MRCGGRATVDSIPGEFLPSSFLLLPFRTRGLVLAGVTRTLGFVNQPLALLAQPDAVALDLPVDSGESAIRALHARLTGHAKVHWAVALVHVEEIDSINILRATHLAMRQAVSQLQIEVDHCLIDGLPVPAFPWAHDGVVKGDGLSLSIAAASVIAKVTRDRWMQEAAREFPQYGFERHQGYGTPEHLAALRSHGPCRIHRRSFQPVSQLTLSFDGA